MRRPLKNFGITNNIACRQKSRCRSSELIHTCLCVWQVIHSRGLVASGGHVSPRHISRGHPHLSRVTISSSPDKRTSTIITFGRTLDNDARLGPVSSHRSCQPGCYTPLFYYLLGSNCKGRSYDCSKRRTLIDRCRKRLTHLQEKVYWGKMGKNKRK